MSVTVTLSSPELDEELLAKWTQELQRELRNDAGVESAIEARLATAEDKAGDIPVWGQIVIAAIGSGGAIVALINVLKAYVSRKKSLYLKLKDANGKTIEVKAENPDEEMVELLKSCFAKQEEASK